MPDHRPPRSLPARPRRALALALLIGVAAAPAHGAALYRWTDADGIVHYADSLPLEAPPSGIEGRPSRTVGEAISERERLERVERMEALRLASEAEQRERERQAQLEAARAALERKTIISPYSCEEARQTLAAQRVPRRTYYTLGEDGEFKPGTAEDAQRNVAEWEQAVEQLCADNVHIVAPGSEEARKALAESARWGEGAEPGQGAQNPQ